MNSEHVTYFGALVAGLLSFVSPCVLPLIPSYITYITGLSFAELQAENPASIVRKQAMLHSLAFIAAFTTVFVLLGASATVAGSFLQEHIVFLRKLGGALITIFGIHVTGLIPLRFLLGEKRVVLLNKPAGYLGSFVVGIAFAAGWTPCIGPILASILMVAATENSVYKGVILLLIYSLGLGIPFFLSALAMHKFMIIFNRFKKFIRFFEVITGLFLVCVGILIYSNSLTRIAGYINIFFQKG